MRYLSINTVLLVLISNDHVGPAAAAIPSPESLRAQKLKVYKREGSTGVAINEVDTVISNYNRLLVATVDDETGLRAETDKYMRTLYTVLCEISTGKTENDANNECKQIESDNKVKAMHDLRNLIELAHPEETKKLEEAAVRFVQNKFLAKGFRKNMAHLRRIRLEQVGADIEGLTDVGEIDRRLKMVKDIREQEGLVLQLKARKAVVEEARLRTESEAASAVQEALRQADKAHSLQEIDTFIGTLRTKSIEDLKRMIPEASRRVSTEQEPDLISAYTRVRDAVVANLLKKLGDFRDVDLGNIQQRYQDIIDLPNLCSGVPGIDAKSDKMSESIGGKYNELQIEQLEGFRGLIGVTGTNLEDLAVQVGQVEDGDVSAVATRKQEILAEIGRKNSQTRRPS